MKARPIGLLIVVLVIAASAAGCGGGGSSEETPATSSLGKAQYLKQANKICVDGETNMSKQLEAYVEEHSSEGNGALVHGSQEVLLPGIQTEIDELRALGLPKGDEQHVEEILDAMQEAVDTAETQTNETPHGLGPLFEHAGALARRYGISGCGFA